MASASGVNPVPIARMQLRLIIFCVLCIDYGLPQQYQNQQEFGINKDRTAQLSIAQQGQILSDIQKHQRFQLPRHHESVLPQQFFTNTAFNLKPRPTEDPIISIDRQISLLHPENDKQKIDELREKQSIIRKHNQFVQKQYEIALQKARNDHLHFLAQQRALKEKIYTELEKIRDGNGVQRRPVPKGRIIYPGEISLFSKAIDQYYKLYPTTTTTAATTTTNAAASISTVNIKSPFLPTVLPRAKEIQSFVDLDHLQKQYKSQGIRKSDFIEQLKLALGKNQEYSVKNLTSREVSPANVRKVQVRTSDLKHFLNEQGNENPGTNGQKLLILNSPQSLETTDNKLLSLLNGQNFQTTDQKNILSALENISLQDIQRSRVKKENNTSTSTIFQTQEIELPNGEKVEVIKTTDPNLIPKGGVKIESGSDIEKILQSKSPATPIQPPKDILDEIRKNVPTSQFEILRKDESGNLESINKTLPSHKKVTFVLLEEQSDGTLKVQGIKGNENKQDVDIESILEKIKHGEIKLPPISSSYATTTTKKQKSISTSPTTPISTPISTTVMTKSSADTGNDEIIPTLIKKYKINQDIPSPKTQLYSSSSNDRLLNKEYEYSPDTELREPIISNNSFYDQTYVSSSLNTKSSPTNSTGALPVNMIGIVELASILKDEGFFAMAKYLKQSGLDTILNETGPYTVFVPTDKAFRTLLVQLGGPQKAEEKFRENPRLLSGLLLHHVIPGAFKIQTLQDEMTGVSLAGTQLRVNEYKMHDAEWNDVKVITINGAKVVEGKEDIEVPQGIAHGIDRVMFPLPVGNIIQTLQSDRERRFTSILRAIFSSGLAETLQGTKTFTLFAPTEAAFAKMSSSDLEKLLTDKSLARELVLKHLLAGTLYTNGLRYYQVKSSLLEEENIKISKQSGTVKINNIPLGTSNIPATNGVIHAINAVL